MNLKRVFLYILSTRKRSLFTWLIVSFMFPAFSIIIECIISLFSGKYELILDIPALEGKVLLGAVLMGAASMLFYYEKKDEQGKITKDKGVANQEDNEESALEDRNYFDFGVLVPIQMVLILAGSMVFAIQTFIVRTKIELPFFKADQNIILISYIVFLIIGLIYLCFKFEFLSREIDYGDFRDWDTGSGQYMKKSKNPFNNIKT